MTFDGISQKTVVRENKQKSAKFNVNLDAESFWIFVCR